MRVWIGWSAWALVLVWASGAVGQANNCTWNGREYAEGTWVCQNGLRQQCMNGEWQSLGDERCDPGAGQGGGGLRLLEQEEKVVEDD